MRYSFDVGLSWGIMSADGDAMASVARLAAAGQMRLPVGAQLPLSSVAEAHRLVDSAEVPGKIVLIM